jgi:hypothetical protein
MCESANLCQQSVCEVQFGQGVCVLQNIPDGEYPIDAAPAPTFPFATPSFLVPPSTAVCSQGVNMNTWPNKYLPKFPLDGPKFQPLNSDQCEAASDCPAPAVCYQSPLCNEGFCAAPVASPLGSTCSDGNAATVGDICSGDGVCKGLTLECPANIDLFPPQTLTTRAWWSEPRPYYLGFAIDLQSSLEPGVVLTVGATTVSYTANSVTPFGRVSAQCSFQITVHRKCK